MKKPLLLTVLLTTFGIFSACGHKGPDIEVCDVEDANKGFFCRSRHYKNRRITYEEAQKLPRNLSLICISPIDIEELIKECKQHRILPVLTCKIGDDLLSFTCTPVEGPAFQAPTWSVDTYRCIAQEDLDRVKQRCR